MKKILKMFVIIAAVMIPSAVANAQPKKQKAVCDRKRTEVGQRIHGPDCKEKYWRIYGK